MREIYLKNKVLWDIIKTFRIFDQAFHFCAI